MIYVTDTTCDLGLKSPLLHYQLWNLQLYKFYHKSNKRHNENMAVITIVPLNVGEDVETYFVSWSYHQ